MHEAAPPLQELGFLKHPLVLPHSASMLLLDDVVVASGAVVVSGTVVVDLNK